MHFSASAFLPQISTAAPSGTEYFHQRHRGSRFVGLYWTQLDYECMRKALTDVQREKFASLLVDYRTGESKGWKRFRLKNFKYATAYTELSRIRTL